MFADHYFEDSVTRCQKRSGRNGEHAHQFVRISFVSSLHWHGEFALVERRYKMIVSCMMYYQPFMGDKDELCRLKST